MVFDKTANTKTETSSDIKTGILNTLLTYIKQPGFLDGFFLSACLMTSILLYMVMYYPERVTLLVDSNLKVENAILKTENENLQKILEHLKEKGQAE